MNKRHRREIDVVANEQKIEKKEQRYLSLRMFKRQKKGDENVQRPKKRSSSSCCK
jgi:hypothetical protein